MWFASVCSRTCKAKPYINVFCLVGNWNKIWRSLRVNVLSKYPFYQNKPFRDKSWPTFTWCWFKPNLFCAHLWLEPITQSEVGPKTSLTMDKGVNGHELYLRIWNLDDRHEVYIRNWRNMFQLNYLDRENIFNTVQQGTLTHTNIAEKVAKTALTKASSVQCLDLAFTDFTSFANFFSDFLQQETVARLRGSHSYWNQFANGDLGVCSIGGGGWRWCGVWGVGGGVGPPAGREIASPPI